MQRYTPVETKYQEVEVVTYADTSSYSHLAQDILHLELASHTVGCVPHIARIDEQCTMQTAKQALPVLQVTQQLDIAVAHQIVCSPVAKRLHTAGSDTSHGESAHTVGTTNIEELAIGSLRGIAITPHIAPIQMSHQMGSIAQRPRLGKVGLYLQKLRIGILEEFLVLLVPPVPLHHIEHREHVARLTERCLPAHGMAHCRGRLISVGIANLRNEIVLHEDLQIGNRADQRIVGGSVGVHKLILHRQGRQLVTALSRRLPAVGPLARHHMHLIITWAIDDVGADLGQRGRGCIEPTATDGPSVLVAPYAIAAKEGGDDARELD